MNKKLAKKKGVTIDDLAVIVQRGFRESAAGIKSNTADIEHLAQMTQRGFEEITAKMVTKDEVNKRFDAVDKRLDRIEYLLVGGLNNRFEILKNKMHIMQTSLGRKK